MQGWFDIGVNLGDKRLANDTTIPDAIAADVQLLAATGTTVTESQNNLALAEQYPNHVYCTAGVHPHYAKDVSEDYLEQLAALASHSAVVAIGECGLDFNRNFSPPDVQLDVFEAQLKLAVKLKMPVFLHERDAFDQQVELLSRYRKDLVGGVAHCFTGNREQLLKYVELDLYVGVTGWVCDPKRGEDLRDAVQALPLNNLVLETDAPYLFPKTLKPKSSTNRPQNLPHIAEQLASIMNVSVEDLQSHAMKNSLALFGIEERVDGFCE